MAVDWEGVVKRGMVRLLLDNVTKGRLEVSRMQERATRRLNIIQLSSWGAQKV